jgi:hypothetical protein
VTSEETAYNFVGWFTGGPYIRYIFYVTDSIVVTKVITVRVVNAEAATPVSRTGSVANIMSGKVAVGEPFDAAFSSVPIRKIGLCIDCLNRHQNK